MSVTPMKPGFQRETRSEVLFRYTQRLLHETRCSMEAFAQRVVEEYHASVPTASRDVEFKTEGDVFKCAAINAQKLRRYMDADINARIPVDLEEAWVRGLPDPYRSECLRDLAARHGLLAVPVPGASAITDMQSVSRLSREFGEVLEAIGPMLENGHFGPEDTTHVGRAVRELEDLLAVGTSILSRLKGLGSRRAGQS
jgi:hypothetical protein